MRLHTFLIRINQIIKLNYCYLFCNSSINPNKYNKSLTLAIGSDQYLWADHVRARRQAEDSRRYAVGALHCRSRRGVRRGQVPVIPLPHAPQQPCVPPHPLRSLLLLQQEASCCADDTRRVVSCCVCRVVLCSPLAMPEILSIDSFTRGPQKAPTITVVVASPVRSGAVMTLRARTSTIPRTTYHFSRTFFLSLCPRASCRRARRCSSPTVSARPRRCP